MPPKPERLEDLCLQAQTICCLDCSEGLKTAGMVDVAFVTEALNKRLVSQMKIVQDDSRMILKIRCSSMQSPAF